MSKRLSTSVAAAALLAGTLLGGAAFAQSAGTGARPGNDIGTGESLPMSNRASNINPSDTSSTVAPRLPAPAVGENASTHDFLMAAQQALRSNRTGEAQEALERAETRALSRSTLADNVGRPSNSSLVEQIAKARQALGGGDRQSAMQDINAALSSADMASSTQ